MNEKLLMTRIVSKLWADSLLAAETLISAGKQDEAENILRGVAAVWGLMEIMGILSQLK